MPKYLFGTDKQLTTEDGLHKIAFKANVPRTVPPRFETLVIGAGGVKEGSVAPSGEDESDSAESELVSDSTDGPGEPERTETGESDSDESGEPGKSGVDEVVAVMKEIIGEDDPRLLTEAQIPRTQEIHRRLGRKTQKAEREEAWAQVEG